MKIRADRTDLAETLAWVARAVSTRPAIPILSSVRLEAANDTLTVSGFDYSTSHTATMSVEVIDDGTVAVSAVKLAQLAASMKGDTLELVLDGAKLTVSAGRSTFGLPVMPVEDYPELPTATTTKGTLTAAVLADMVDQVSHAADDGNTLEAIRGVLIDSADGHLTLAATDRYQMSTVTRKWTGGDFTAHVLVKPLTEALRGLDGDIEVGADDTRFSLTGGGRTSTDATVAEDGFPWRNFQRADHTTNVTVDVADLIDAVKRLLIVTENMQALRVEAVDSELHLSAAGESEGVEVVAAETDGPITVYLQPGYLLAAAKHIRTDQVTFGLIGAEKPVHLLSTDDVMHVVMPVRNRQS